MLSERYGLDELRNTLTTRDTYRPHPTIEDRGAWEALPGSIRAAHLRRGEEAAADEYPMTPATAFLDFARNGNRSRYQNLDSKRRAMLADLVLAECIEAKGRFLDPIVDGIWCICEETYWGVPAHIGMQKAGVDLPDVTEPTVDLFAAETAALLAWTSHLLGDKLDTVSKLVRPRIEYETDRRILTPCFERDDFWWMGLRANARVNNWTPWICSNWLTCVLLIEDDPDRRLHAVSKILRCLDVFIQGYPADGGCDEGPGYWNRAGASLYDCLELLHSATDGTIDIYREPLIQNMGRFICRAHISDGWLVNFADAGARGRPPGPIVFGFGKAIGDEDMIAYGAFCAARTGFRENGAPGGLGRALPALFTAQELLSAEPRQPLPRDVWLPDTQVMVARSRERTTDGFFLAAKGGHNAESHNHNDVGQFIVFRDGKPLLIDIGVETYTRKTFSDQRYSIWTMQSRWHNLPTVNDVTQLAGIEYAARDLSYEADDAAVRFALDLAHAYPKEAGILSWRRSFTFQRGGEIVVEDAYRLGKEPQSLYFSLITPCEVSVGADGVIALGERELPGSASTGTATLRFDAAVLSASVEEAPVEDSGLRNVWGDRLFRIELKADPGTEGSYTLRIAE